MSDRELILRCLEAAAKVFQGTGPYNGDQILALARKMYDEASRAVYS